MVTPGRFELPTCGLGNRRSIHLSYGATLKAALPTPAYLQMRGVCNAAACSAFLAFAIIAGHKKKRPLYLTGAKLPWFSRVARAWLAAYGGVGRGHARSLG